MAGRALVVRADAFHLPMPDESVDLIASSPPYFGLRSYRDGDEHYVGQIGSEPTPQAFLEALWAVMHECWRVLKPTGSCFINLGDKRNSAASGQNGTGSTRLTGGRHDRMAGRGTTVSTVRPKSKMLLPHRFAIGCEDGLADPEGKGWVMRSDIVWQKLNGLPESVTDRCRDSHEYLFHMTKSERYFVAVDEVRENHSRDWSDSIGPNNQSVTGARDNGCLGRASGTQSGLASAVPNPLGKLPGSVWALPSEPLVTPDWRIVRGGRTVEWCDTWEQATKVAGAMGVRRGRPSIRPEVDHFAAFPTELVRRIVLGWSPSAVCAGCGEGRRPVVARTLETTGHTNRRTGGKRDLAESQGNDRGFNGNGYPIARSDAIITGYACRCGIPAPPTNPARVLDVFGGTGTTAGVARALGRHGVSVDLSHDYSRLARYMIERSGRFSKVVDRTNKQNQGSLL